MFEFKNDMNEIQEGKGKSLKKCFLKVKIQLVLLVNCFHWLLSIEFVGTKNLDQNGLVEAKC